MLSEETMKVLKMIEEGKITAEQGQKLLEAASINDGKENNCIVKAESVQKKLKYIRVNVDVKDKNKKNNAKVDVNIPISIAKKLSKLTSVIPNDAKKEMAEKGIDIDSLKLDELIEMFERGEIDRNLVDINVGDENEGAVVKVYVE